MGKKKKVNPRRIPLAKSAIDKDVIINEAMHDDMFHAWLLVASALVELGFARPDEIHDLSQHVNRYSKTHHPKRLDAEARLPNPCRGDSCGSNRGASLPSRRI